jgi:hypothetical protein
MKILKNVSNAACSLVFSDAVSDTCDAYAGGNSDVPDAELDLDNALDENDKKSEKLLDESAVDLPLD